MDIKEIECRGRMAGGLVAQSVGVGPGTGFNSCSLNRRLDVQNVE